MGGAVLAAAHAMVCVELLCHAHSAAIKSFGARSNFDLEHEVGQVRSHNMNYVQFIYRATTLNVMVHWTRISCHVYGQVWLMLDIQRKARVPAEWLDTFGFIAVLISVRRSIRFLLRFWNWRLWVVRWRSFRLANFNYFWIYCGWLALKVSNVIGMLLSAFFTLISSRSMWYRYIRITTQLCCSYGMSLLIISRALDFV